MTIAELLIPALAADAGGRFDGARERAAEALALGVGGFVLTGGEQDAVRAFAKELQQRSRTPLLVGAELERGAGQRFSGATGLPPLAAVAWLNDPEALRRAARLTAREARTMGVNWNVAPVVDLDLDDRGAGLGTRSLGGDADAVARLAGEWITACQAEGVLACAKHFPGRGRVTAGPAGELPVVRADRDTLHATDLAPFRAAIDAGVASILTAHAAYPTLDPGGAPATLSRELLQWLLRQQLRFDGLIVADLGQMAPVGDEAETVERAIASGCDVILAPADLARTAAALERALAERRLDPERVRQSQRRRLKWAQWAAPPNDWRRPTAADAAWGAQLADRVVHVSRGAPPASPAGAAVDVVIVDDAAPAAGGAAGRALVDTLGTAGLAARAVVDAGRAASDVPLLLALFGDAPAGYGAATRARVAELSADADAASRPLTVVQFAHPRRVGELPGTAPVVTAWSGDRAMQQAVARWVAARAARRS